MISYEISGDKTKALVSVPFAHKDLFKSYFTTAKWDSANKCWTVLNRPSNIAKLDTFIENAKAFLVKAAEVEEIEEAELDLDKLTRDLADMSAKLDKTINTKKALVEIKAGFDAMSVKHAEVKAELIVEQVARNSLADGIKAKVDDLIAPYDVHAKINRLLRLRGMGVGSKISTEANQIQVELLKIYEEIAERSGVKIHALRLLYNVNWNRKDRDIPADEAAKLYTQVTFA